MLSPLLRELRKLRACLLLCEARLLRGITYMDAERCSRNTLQWSAATDNSSRDSSDGTLVAAGQVLECRRSLQNGLAQKLQNNVGKRCECKQ